MTLQETVSHNETTSTPQYNILVATDLTETSLHLLEEAEDVEFKVVPPKTAKVREALRQAHVVITRDDFQLDAPLLEHAPHLRMIARVSASLNGLDMEAATERGIMVMNTPGTSAIAAGEHTMTLMLALSRKLTVVHNSIKDGWWLLDRRQHAGTQLYGKTIGLVGLGRVGKHVASRCFAFGMTVLAYDPYISEANIPDDRITMVSFKKLLERSDYVSLHVPSTRETVQLFDAETISQMKTGARLINVAHGSLIDEQALAEAIKEGHLAGAAVDVFHEEPPYNSPLVGLEQVIHTPHIGDNTIEALDDLSTQIIQQVLDALRDQDYRNVVNIPLIPGTDYETIRPYLRLAETIGSLQHSLARTAISRVEVEIRGEEMQGLIKPMTVGILKGLLSPVLGDKVSAVNAPLLATERGWQITQAKGLKSGDYANVVTCQVTLEDGDHITISGTLLDHKEPYIVQINNYRMNFVPHGSLLLMGSYDKPGVIGQVGTLLAKNLVNIAGWYTGRAQPGGNTLTVLTLDEPIPDSVLNALREQEFVRHAHQIQFD